jgi:hypothetical protein
MSKAAINIQFTVGAAYASIATTPKLFRGSATNYSANPIYVKGVDGSGSAADVPGFPPGFTQDYSAVDLSTLLVKGTPGDTLAFVGEAVERIEQGTMY